MKLGGFGTIKDYEAISAAGYDYAELDIPELESLTEKDFARFKEKVTETGTPVLIGGRIFPFNERIFFKDGFQPMEFRNYMERACYRVAKLGAKKIILGNGKARSLQSADDLKKEPFFIDFVRMIAKIAGKNGLILLIEPLGPKYSNYINTLPEAVSLIEKAAMSNLFLMADLRHMVWSNEDFKDLITYARYLRHIHMDYPLSYPDRPYLDPRDGYDYQIFLDKLLQISYCDTLTIEADVPNDWNAAHQNAVMVLKSVLC